METNIIWCLFSVANMYDQPDNNLVTWWKVKPNFETVLKAIGGSFENEKSILAAADLIQKGEVNHKSAYSSAHYRLEQIEEGKILDDKL